MDRAFAMPLSIKPLHAFVQVKLQWLMPCYLAGLPAFHVELVAALGSFGFSFLCHRGTVAAELDKLTWPQVIG